MLPSISCNVLNKNQQDTKVNWAETYTLQSAMCGSFYTPQSAMCGSFQLHQTACTAAKYIMIKSGIQLQNKELTSCMC